MTPHQIFLRLGAQLPVIWNSFVLAAGNEVEEILLEVGAGAGDGVNFVLTDHFRERYAKLSRAHRSGQRDHHFSAMIEMSDVGVGGVFQDGGVEVPKMLIDKSTDTAQRYLGSSRRCPCSFSVHKESYSASLRNWARIFFSEVTDFYGKEAIIRAISIVGMTPKKTTTAARTASVSL